MKNKFSLDKNNLHIVEKSKIWFAVPAIIVLITLIVFFSFAGVNDWDFSEGINIGIDFAGGTSISVKMGEEYSEAKLNQLKKDVESQGVKVSYAQKTGTDDKTAAVVKYKNIAHDDETNNAKNAQILKFIQDKYGIDNVANASVGSTASGELLATSFLAIFVAAICIFIYIIFRFELWSGLSAVIALFHDLLIMFCLTVIFHIQINAPYIAALITILAYSINDTIVIFDRVRELIKNNTSAKIDYQDIANRAISSSLTRSIYTSITTLITISVVAIFIPQIRDFALPIVFGILAGTYSSIFIAAPLYVKIKNSLANSKRAKAEKALAVANGVEYVAENDYQNKAKAWNNFKSKFSSNSSSKAYSPSTKVESEVESEPKKEKKKQVQQPFVNVKKKKKQK